MKDKLFYGWVVVIAFSIIYIVVSGIRFSFGVFFKSLVNEFGLTRAELGYILSTCYLAVCLPLPAAVLINLAEDTISLMGLFTGLSLILTSQAQSLWQLFVVYSLLLAMGYGGVFVVCISMIVRWFDKKRGLAIGLTTSGVGLGTVIIAPFAAYLL
jgi:sugar phosphate permease